MSNKKSISYFVNGVKYESEDKKLKVSFILENSGFRPITDYRFIRVNGNKEFNDYEEEIPIHNDEEFIIVFKGVTPVSLKVKDNDKR